MPGTHRANLISCLKHLTINMCPHLLTLRRYVTLTKYVYNCNLYNNSSVIRHCVESGEQMSSKAMFPHRLAWSLGFLSSNKERGVGQELARAGAVRPDQLWLGWKSRWKIWALGSFRLSEPCLKLVLWSLIS